MEYEYGPGAIISVIVCLALMFIALFLPMSEGTRRIKQACLGFSLVIGGLAICLWPNQALVYHSSSFPASFRYDRITGILVGVPLIVGGLLEAWYGVVTRGALAHFQLGNRK